MDIERHKENIKPIRGGREASSLSETLVPKSDQLEAQRFKFEELIRCTQGEDLLETYFRYIKWMVQHWPNGNTNVLRKICQDGLSKIDMSNEGIKNDDRLLYIWKIYASLTKSGAISIYQHMKSFNYCTGIAKFYTEFADKYEAQNDINEAINILKEGLRYGAKPVSLLEEHIEIMKLRQARSAIDKVAQDHTHDDFDDTRTVLGQLDPITKENKVSAYRAGTSIPAPIPKLGQVSSNVLTKRGFQVLTRDDREIGTKQARLRGTTPAKVLDRKENEQTAGKWTEAKNTRHEEGAHIAPSKNKPFAVFSDMNEPTDQRPHLHSTRALQPIESQTDFISHPLSAQFKNPYGKPEGKHGYDVDMIMGGSIEFSFEEIRALKWKKKGVEKAHPTDVPIASPNIDDKVETLKAPLKESKAVDQGHQATNIKARPKMEANSSFTINLLKEMRKDFSNTLNISENANPHTAFPPPASRHNKIVVPEAKFKIYEEPISSPNKQPTISMNEKAYKQKEKNMFVAPLNKPKAFTVYEEPEISNPKTVTSTAEQNEQYENPTINNNMANLDLNSPTIAKFGQLNMDRANSTPGRGERKARPSWSAVAAFNFGQAEPTVILPPALEEELSPTPEFKDTKQHTNGDNNCQSIIGQVNQFASINKFQVTVEEKTEDGCQFGGSSGLRTLSTITEKSNEQSIGRLSIPSNRQRSHVPSESFASPAILAPPLNSPMTDEVIKNDQKTADIKSLTPPVTIEMIRSKDDNNQDRGDTVEHVPRRRRTLLLTQIEEENKSPVKYMSKEEVEQSFIVNLPTPNQIRQGSFSQELEQLPIKNGINPFSAEYRLLFYKNVAKRNFNATNFHVFDEKRPVICNKGIISIAGFTYNVQRMIAEGGFSKVYRATESSDPHHMLVLKVACKAFDWEFYAVSETRERLNKLGYLNQMTSYLMKIEECFSFDDGIIIVDKYEQYGNLIDLVNGNNALHNNKPAGIGELMCAYYTLHIMNAVFLIHQAGFLHGDIKPDNFLITRLPSAEFTDAHSLLPPELNSQATQAYEAPLRLIDYGMAIDMNILPEDIEFSGKSNTSGFMCPAMLDGKPWSKHCDYFGLVATIHTLLFGHYMKTHYDRFTKRLVIIANYQRAWTSKAIYRRIFEEILNMAPGNDCLPAVIAKLNELYQELAVFLLDFLNDAPLKWKQEVLILQRVFKQQADNLNS